MLLSPLSDGAAILTTVLLATSLVSYEEQKVYLHSTCIVVTLPSLALLCFCCQLPVTQGKNDGLQENVLRMGINKRFSCNHPPSATTSVNVIAG